MQLSLGLEEPAQAGTATSRAPARAPGRKRAEQTTPWLPGLGIERLDNLFFALQPDPAARGKIHAVVRQAYRDEKLAGSLLAPPDYHISLHGLGVYEGVPGQVRDKAFAAANLLCMPPFEVVFDSAMSFLGNADKQAFVLCGGNAFAELRAFHRRLGEAMRACGLRKHVRSGFTPHVTMAYLRQTVTQRPIEPIRWTAERFLLIHSPQRYGLQSRRALPTEPRHIILGEWS